MFSNALIKTVLVFSFSIFVSFIAQAQSQHVIVILNDKTSYVGELLEMTPDSVTIIDEDTGENLVLNGPDISSVYIKETGETIRFPMTETPNISEQIEIMPATENYGYPKAVASDSKNIQEEESAPIKFSFGFGAGGLSSITKSGIKDFKDTEFKGGTCFSGYINLVFEGDFSAGLLIQQMDMDLEENGYGFGTLTLTPVIFMMQWYSFPEVSGLGGHAGLGVGINIPEFETGGYVTELEQQTGTKIVVETNNAVVFEINAGFDYYFIRNVALIGEGRLIIGDIGTSWAATANGNSVPIEGFDSFLISNFQYLAGLRVWF